MVDSLVVPVRLGTSYIETNIKGIFKIYLNVVHKHSSSLSILRLANKTNGYNVILRKDQSNKTTGNYQDG